MCRQQDMGRWAERQQLTRDVIQAIRSTVNNHPEIWTAEVLKVDGWVSNEKGWTLPLAPLKGGQGGP